MSSEVVEAAFRAVLCSRYVSGRLTVVWHAGEPLVVPPEWYETAFITAERFRPPALTVEQSFQSNGTLLDERWIAFFAQTKATIGLSIDGPVELHDSHRRTRRGRGTFAAAMRGLALLRESGIPFHVISVLTRAALEQPDTLYDFYIANQIRAVAFNVQEQEGVHTGRSLHDDGYAAAFGRFLKRFLSRMSLEPGRIELRELDGALAVIRDRGLAGGGQETRPMGILSIDIHGNVASFSPEFLGMRHPKYGDFCFGNVLKDDMDAIAERIRHSTLCHDIAAGVEACRQECAWFAYCGGGAPSNKLYENGTVESTETAFCRLTRQMVLDAVMTELEARAP